LSPLVDARTPMDPCGTAPGWLAKRAPSRRGGCAQCQPRHCEQTSLAASSGCCCASGWGYRFSRKAQPCQSVHWATSQHVALDYVCTHPAGVAQHPLVVEDTPKHCNRDETRGWPRVRGKGVPIHLDHVGRHGFLSLSYSRSHTEPRATSMHGQKPTPWTPSSKAGPYP